MDAVKKLKQQSVSQNLENWPNKHEMNLTTCICSHQGLLGGPLWLRYSNALGRRARTVQAVVGHAWFAAKIWLLNVLVNQYLAKSELAKKKELL